MTQARAALWAAILLSATSLRSIAERIPLFEAGGSQLWLFTHFIGDVIWPLALPALLVVFYKSGTPLSLSTNLRRLALGASIVLGGLFGALPLGAMLVFSLMGLRTPSASALGWELLFLFSQLALALFLIALARPAAQVARNRHSGSRPLRNAAMVAILAGVIAVILSVSNAVTNAHVLASAHGGLLMQGNHATWWDGPTELQIVLGGVLNIMPEFCRLMIPLVVYRSLNSGNERSSAPIESPQQS